MSLGLREEEPDLRGAVGRAEVDVDAATGVVAHDRRADLEHGLAMFQVIAGATNAMKRCAHLVVSAQLGAYRTGAARRGGGWSRPLVAARLLWLLGGEIGSPAPFAPGWSVVADTREAQGFQNDVGVGCPVAATAKGDDGPLVVRIET